MEAVLLASGEVGYRSVTVATTVARYGGDPTQLYADFENLGECFAAAYASRIDALAAEILDAAAAAPGWRQGLRAALEVVAAFVTARPLTARALLIEVHIAGEPALGKRRQTFERLARAIDSARREADAEQAPPPLTALFMLSAIETAVVSALISGKPEAFAEAVPDLGQMIVAAYFGDGEPEA